MAQQGHALCISGVSEVRQLLNRIRGGEEVCICAGPLLDLGLCDLVCLKIPLVVSMAIGNALWDVNQSRKRWLILKRFLKL